MISPVRITQRMIFNNAKVKCNLKNVIPLFTSNSNTLSFYAMAISVGLHVLATHCVYFIILFTQILDADFVKESKGKKETEYKIHFQVCNWVMLLSALFIIVLMLCK